MPDELIPLDPRRHSIDVIRQSVALIALPGIFKAVTRFSGPAMPFHAQNVKRGPLKGDRPQFPLSQFRV
jgi:hypothetical protein